MKYCFGIDIGGTSIKTGLFTEEGGETGLCSLPARIGGNGTHIYDDAAESVRTMLDEYGISASDVLRVGVAVPGPVYGDGRIGLANNLAIYGGYPAEEISARLGGIKAVTVNDANAAGLGELWAGSGKDCRSLCLVTLGTGVGSAIIIDGKVVTGKHGAGGEIGHICVEPEEKEPCNCGARGCCEFYASATGIVRVAGRMLASGDPMIPVSDGSANGKGRCTGSGSRLEAFGDRLTARDVCDLAKTGDALACRILDFSMDRLARALAAVTLTVDPEVFVIGGGVAAAGSVLTDRIGTGLCRYLPIIRERDHKVRTALLGNKAGMYGAAKLALEGGETAGWHL